MMADCFKISLDTLYEQRAMIKRGRNRKFKRGYAVCQFVDSTNELQLLQQDEKSIKSNDTLFRGSVGCVFDSKIYLGVTEPRRTFGLHGICAVVIVLRILTEILFSGLKFNRESLCCELYRLVGTIVGKNLNIENKFKTSRTTYRLA